MTRESDTRRDAAMWSLVAEVMAVQATVTGMEAENAVMAMRGLEPTYRDDHFVAQAERLDRLAVELRRASGRPDDEPQKIDTTRESSRLFKCPVCDVDGTIPKMPDTVTKLSHVVEDVDHPELRCRNCGSFIASWDGTHWIAPE